MHSEFEWIIQYKEKGQLNIIFQSSLYSYTGVDTNMSGYFKE